MILNLHTHCRCLYNFNIYGSEDKLNLEGIHSVFMVHLLSHSRYPNYFSPNHYYFFVLINPHKLWHSNKKVTFFLLLQLNCFSCFSLMGFLMISTLMGLICYNSSQLFYPWSPWADFRLFRCFEVPKHAEKHSIMSYTLWLSFLKWVFSSNEGDWFRKLPLKINNSGPKYFLLNSIVVFQRNQNSPNHHLCTCY